MGPATPINKLRTWTGRGEVEIVGAAGAEWALGLGGGVGGGKQKAIRSPHILKVMVPVGTLITTAAVARNGRPKMRGTGKSSSMSRMTKSHGMRNVST